MQFSHTFELDHVFKEFIRHIYILTVSFILVTGHEHALHLRHHIVFYLYQQKKKHTKGKSLSLLEFKASDSACSLVTTLIELPELPSGFSKFYSPF